ncbi:hypothetical protein F4803DRAFT_513759 [Xylaria telfairii]|nr:hypothetical protein F4803DRAFT_513759 [Xylaria telfairii]
MSFPKFTCVQCTRRLSRLAQSSKPSCCPRLRQRTPRVSPEYRPSLATHSLYSTASGRRIARAAETADFFTKVRFTRADLPPWEFWDAHARTPLVTDLSADECLQTAQAYADAALKDIPGWRERLITTAAEPPDSTSKRKALSAYTLHYVAVMIALAGMRQVTPLATHILYTLTGLDYVPSILTLVRIAVQMKMLGRPQFESAFQGLERTLQRIGDGSSKSSARNDSEIDLAADACTLRAIIYASEHTREGDNNALRWYRRAYEMGGAVSEPSTRGSSSTADQPHLEKQRGDKGDASQDSGGIDDAKFDPRWQWKPSFALGVAAIRMKRGELEKAMDMYTMASSELDNATGYLGMVNVLEKEGKENTDEYVEALEKAAVSGEQGAARKLGTREWDRAAEGGLSKWEKRKRQVVAEEWMAIAGVAVPAEA